MLDSRRLAVPEIGHPRHIAGGVHIARGLAGAVAHDPVVECETAALKPLRVAHNPDAHHDDVRFDAVVRRGECDCPKGRRGEIAAPGRGRITAIR